MLYPAAFTTGPVRSAAGGDKIHAGRRRHSQPRPLRIYVARHGQDEDNASGVLNGRRDMPLTPLGERQARTVAAKIRGSGLVFDAVYASPLRRAHRTAEIIVEELSAEDAAGGGGGGGGGDGDNCGGGGGACCRTVIRMDDLVERDFGVLTGTPASEIAERCGDDDVLKTDTITYFLSPEGAETFPDLLERSDALLARVRTELHPSGDTILLVTHGDFGKMLYASYYNLGWRDVLRGFHFGNSEVLLLAEDSSAEEAHVFEIKQHNH